MSQFPQGLDDASFPSDEVAVTASAIPPSKITPGAGGRLSIPSSSGDGGYDDDGPGLDGDFSDQIPSIEKPPRDGFIKIHHKGIIVVDLYKKQEGYDSSYFYIKGRRLQDLVREDIRRYKVIPYIYDDKFFLWVLSYPAKSAWYDSIAKLFRQPDEFYAQNEVRIRAGDGRYQVKYLPNPTEITWPAETTNELLADAIGPDSIIDSADHPIFRQLMAGSELK